MSLYSPSEEEIQRGYNKKELDELRENNLQAKGTNFCCPWKVGVRVVKIVHDNQQIQNRYPKKFPNLRSYLAEQVFHEIKNL